MQIGDKIQFTYHCVAIVKYIGEVEGKEGIWIGLELDKPLGKHNGTYESKKYFECSDYHGILYRQEKLKRDIHLNKNIMLKSTDEKSGSTLTNTNRNELQNEQNRANNKLDYEYKTKVQKIIKESKNKLTIKKLKKDIENLRLDSNKITEVLQTENENLKHKLDEKNKLLEKYKNKFSDFILRIESFEVEFTKLVKGLKNTKYLEDAEYQVLCKYFKGVILSAIENKNEDLEKNLKEFKNICQKNDV